MLPTPNIPTLTVLLSGFGTCFTAPGYRTFSSLAIGLVAQTRRRTVCGMLLGAGLEHSRHHARAHRFFSAARWCADEVGLAMTDLIVLLLLPPQAAIVVVVDDTLFRRSGKKVFGTAWHHDRAAKGPKPIGFGNCRVIAGIVADLPFSSRPVCLPVLARLWRPRRTGKIAYARELAELIAARYPNRTVHTVGDAAYVGEQLRGLDKQITWTSRLKVTSVLHEPAPPRTGKSGRPRTKGARIGTPGDLAKTAAWRTATVRRYGRDDTVELCDTTCLWYGSFPSQTVRVILVRDGKPRTKNKDDRGYGLPLVTTDLASRPEELITRYAARWCIEVAFFDARQTLGVGQARNRPKQAVERTVPFGMICLSLVTVWYATAGHTPNVAAERRAHSPWYRTKVEPSFEDMTVKLRRVIIAARFRGPRPDLATPEETQAVLLAWAAAGT